MKITTRPVDQQVMPIETRGRVREPAKRSAPSERVEIAPR